MCMFAQQECSVLREPAVNQIWRPLPAKQALTVLQDRHQPRLPALPPHTTLPLVEMRSLTAWTVPRDLSVLVGKQHPTGSVLQDIFAPARVTRQPRTLVLRATIGMSLVGKVLVVAQCARVDTTVPGQQITPFCALVDRTAQRDRMLQLPAHSGHSATPPVSGAPASVLPVSLGAFVMEQVALPQLGCATQAFTAWRIHTPRRPLMGLASEACVQRVAIALPAPVSPPSVLVVCSIISQGDVTSWTAILAQQACTAPGPTRMLPRDLACLVSTAREVVSLPIVSPCSQDILHPAGQHPHSPASPALGSLRIRPSPANCARHPSFALPQLWTTMTTCLTVLRVTIAPWGPPNQPLVLRVPTTTRPLPLM